MSFITDIFNPIGDLTGDIFSALSDPIEAIGEGIASIPDVIEEVEDDLESFFNIIIRFIKLLIKFLEIFYKMLQKSELIIDFAFYLLPIAIEIYYYGQILSILKEQEQIKNDFPQVFEYLEYALIIAFGLLTYLIYSESSDLGLGWNGLYPETLDFSKKPEPLTKQNHFQEIVTAHQERVQVRVELENLFANLDIPPPGDSADNTPDDVHHTDLMINLIDSEINKFYYLILAILPGTQPNSLLAEGILDEVRKQWKEQLEITDDLLTTEIIDTTRAYIIEQKKKIQDIFSTWVRTKRGAYSTQVRPAATEFANGVSEPNIRWQEKEVAYSDGITLKFRTVKYNYIINYDKAARITELKTGYNSGWYEQLEVFNDLLGQRVQAIQNYTFVKPKRNNKIVITQEDIAAIKTELEQGLFTTKRAVQKTTTQLPTNVN